MFKGAGRKRDATTTEDQPSNWIGKGKHCLPRKEQIYVYRLEKDGLRFGLDKMKSFCLFQKHCYR